MQAIINIHDFLALSAALNYQLTGSPVNWRAILALTLGDRFSDEDEEVILQVFHYLDHAYGQAKRQLGPYAILHPIRAMALLVRASRQPTLLDILTILLHDRMEEFSPGRYSAETWQALEDRYETMLGRIDPTDNWFLNERVDFLTIKDGEMYYNYLGRMLEKARNTPELVRIKLADRLDNTLDLRIDLQDAPDEVDCFEMIFSVLYTEGYGYMPSRRHPPSGKINGSRRLYQLFKNAVFLTLLRGEGLDRVDPTAASLFSSLARASLREAQRNLIHLFLYHLPDPKTQREILHDVMGYCQQGAITQVTDLGHSHRLDGLFKHRFDHADKSTRKRRLDELYQDKFLMAEVAVAFMAIFSSFLSNPDYRIRGIDPSGIHPEEMLKP